MSPDWLSKGLRSVWIVTVGVVFAYALVHFFELWAESKQRSLRTPPAEPAKPASPPPPEEKRPPSPEELAKLYEPDWMYLLPTVRTLFERQVTPELRSTVADALSRAVDENRRRLLRCLQSRFPEAEALAIAVEEARALGPYLGGGGDPSATCLLETLALRVREAPEDIVPILTKGAFARDASLREAALGGLARVGERPVPEEIRRALRSDQKHPRLFAYEAAFAMKGLEDEPLVEAALDDPYHGVRSEARYRLVRTEGSRAARLLARAASRRPRNEELQRAVAEREARSHDVTAALLEVALGPLGADSMRQGALELIAMHGDPGAIDRLSALAHSGNEVLAAHARAALKQLEVKREAGYPVRMRSLDPGSAP